MSLLRLRDAIKTLVEFKICSTIHSDKVIKTKLLIENIREGWGCFDQENQGGLFLLRLSDKTTKRTKIGTKLDTFTNISNYIVIK